jgi:hypothetical protein
MPMAPLPPPPFPAATQLVLPLALPLPSTPPGAPPLALPPTQVWASLPPSARDRVRRTLVHLLQEVVHDAHS